ncbi:MAG: hypothetical protein KC486_27290, partial [Myxococcales bacterium]|nr:hypothetical protein [Myxococcales bacterium]
MSRPNLWIQASLSTPWRARSGLVVSGLALALACGDDGATSATEGSGGSTTATTTTTAASEA